MSIYPQRYKLIFNPRSIQLLPFFLDTEWWVADSSGNKIAHVSNSTYGDSSYDKVDMCVLPGAYNFTITDIFSGKT